MTPIKKITLEIINSIKAGAIHYGKFGKHKNAYVPFIFFSEVRRWEKKLKKLLIILMLISAPCYADEKVVYVDSHFLNTYMARQEYDSPITGKITRMWGILIQVHSNGLTTYSNYPYIANQEGGRRLDWYADENGVMSISFGWPEGYWNTHIGEIHVEYEKESSID